MIKNISSDIIKANKIYTLKYYNGYFHIMNIDENTQYKSGNKITIDEENKINHNLIEVNTTKKFKKYFTI